MPDRDFPHASLVEGLRFTAQVALPNVVQGLFRRRRTAAGAATRAGVDSLAAGFVAGLRRNYGDGPLWIRVGTEEALLLLGREATRWGLEGSPDPFAADPDPKGSGMREFQPEALTISRDPEWSDRRRFTEAVLGTGEEGMGERFADIAAQEARGLPRQLDWEPFNAAVRRAARRIILGDAAADDTDITTMLGELMDKANPPGGGDEQLLGRYLERLEAYVEAGEEGSLVGAFPQAPVTEVTQPVRQVTHWLFAMGDTLAINAFRCLALLAGFPVERERARRDGDYLGACLQEAMRLWPTTPMLSRQAVRDAEWDGVTVPEGTQLLIVNTWAHRDPEDVPFAHHFAPQEWLSGSAVDDWQFNHLSHGPQGCPGAGLAVLVGRGLLGTVLDEREVQAEGAARLDPHEPLPHMLDYFALRFTLEPR